MMGFDTIRQEWTLDGSYVGLAVTNGGLAVQIGANPIESVVERTIDGAEGFVLTRPNGQLDVIWPTTDRDHWGSLNISASLAPRVNEIVSAVVSR